MEKTTMTYRSEREDFILTMAKHGVPADTARLVLRHANTVQRLAVRECNGDDWNDGALVKCPLAAKPRGKWCPECGAQDPDGGHERVTRSQVKSAQVERRIAALLKPYRLATETQGDPRGYCVRVRTPGCKTDSDAVGVPTRRF